ncbi:hypothetical protein [Erythrobacter sp. HKB08]|uniref:hypothetical protein n=1 Tax=Erythrobacter sp. HKB08 TaxID=2502843 RepID=UPI001009044F|nr:hypothetical protein [Erythrobacter sp. HKB08]
MFKLKGRSEGTRSKEALRYRAYIWLMNLALLVTFAWILEIIVRRSTGIPGLGLTGTADFIAFLIVQVCSFVLPFFLMLFRFMRDDYTEMLWKRSVVVLAYLVAIFPIAFAAVAWSAELGLPKDGGAYAAWRTIYEPFIAPGAPADYVVSMAWKYYMAAFVIIFQFLRWWDSR